MALDFNWQDGDRVMFLGDAAIDEPSSYTKLVPAMVTARYPERKIDYDPEGVGGNRIGDVLERLPRDVFNGKHMPTWILLSVGQNDVFFEGSMGTPLGRFREEYEALLERLKGTKATVACMTTGVIGEDPNTPMNETLTGYNDAIREVAFRNGAQVIDVNADFTDAIQRAHDGNPDFHYTEDGQHPNTYGEYLITLSILRAMHFAV